MRTTLLSTLGLLALLATACRDHGTRAPATAATAGATIAIDGSSTVYPITEAVAEAYRAVDATRVTVGVSGTGGGFKKFCHGEIAIAGASRPIKPSEVEACAAAGVASVELPVAYDGIAVVVHPQNDWVDHLTVQELRRLWEPAAQGKIVRWSQVRTGWPEREVHLFGPGVDSGTYDYFTQVIVGTEHSSRGDFTSSEDDNVLVQGVASDPGALGFFGYAYYAENTARLRRVPIDDGVAGNGDGPILPAPETVDNSTYQPLSRPIFIYVAVAALDRPEVERFVRFYLEQTATLVPEVGFMSLPAAQAQQVQQRLQRRVTGSLYAAGAPAGTLAERLQQAR